MNTTSNTTPFASTFEAAKKKVSAELAIEATRKAEKSKILIDFAQPVIEFMQYLDSLPEVTYYERGAYRSFLSSLYKGDLDYFKKRIEDRNTYYIDTMLGYVHFSIDDSFKCIIDIGPSPINSIQGSKLVYSPYENISFTDSVKFIEYISDLVAKKIVK